MKKAFTLAEIMIVLSVIVIITTILLPAARNATPNEDLMKFKQTYEALTKTLSELVNSDLYYLNGDLGIRINGDLLDGYHDGDFSYFCNSLADNLKTKEINCEKNNDFCSAPDFNTIWYDTDSFDCAGVECNIYEKFDFDCTRNKNIKKFNQVRDLVLQNGAIFIESSVCAPFGITRESTSQPGLIKRVFTYQTDDRFEVVYKTFCLDIDGVLPSTTEDDCANNCPFGFGIRVDGKLIPGSRAQEWLNKSIQEK